MTIHCNAGVTSTNQVGDLDGYGMVWYNLKTIATYYHCTVSQDDIMYSLIITYTTHLLSERTTEELGRLHQGRRGYFVIIYLQ